MFFAYIALITRICHELELNTPELGVLAQPCNNFLSCGSMTVVPIDGASWSIDCDCGVGSWNGPQYCALEHALDNKKNKS